MNSILWTVIATLVFGSLLAPFASEAQQPAKIPRVGFLAPSPIPTPAAPHPGLKAFRQGRQFYGGLSTMEPAMH